MEQRPSSVEALNQIHRHLKEKLRSIVTKWMESYSEGPEQFADDNEFSQYMQREAQKFEIAGQIVTFMGVTRVPVDSGNLESAFDLPKDLISSIQQVQLVSSMTKLYQTIMKRRQPKINWAFEDLAMLGWLLCFYSWTFEVPYQCLIKDSACWKFCSSIIPGFSSKDCLFRWMQLKKYKLTEHAWTEQQQLLLSELCKKYEGSTKIWKVVSQELYLRLEGQDHVYRSAKQCKEHYMSFMRQQPRRTNWFLEEDYILLACMLTNGLKKKWIRHINLFPGRTESALKNRYKLLEGKLMIKNASCHHAFRLVINKIVSIRSQLQRKSQSSDASIIAKGDQLVSEVLDRMTLSEKSSLKIQKLISMVEGPQQSIKIEENSHSVSLQDSFNQPSRAIQEEIDECSGQMENIEVLQEEEVTIRHYGIERLSTSDNLNEIKQEITSEKECVSGRAGLQAEIKSGNQRLKTLLQGSLFHGSLKWGSCSFT